MLGRILENARNMKRENATLNTRKKKKVQVALAHPVLPRGANAVAMAPREEREKVEGERKEVALVQDQRALLGIKRTFRATSS